MHFDVITFEFCYLWNGNTLLGINLHFIQDNCERPVNTDELADEINWKINLQWTDVSAIQSSSPFKVSYSELCETEGAFNHHSVIVL